MGKETNQTDLTSTLSLSLEKFSSHSIDGMISFIHPTEDEATSAQQKSYTTQDKNTAFIFFKVAHPRYIIKYK